MTHLSTAVVICAYTLDRWTDLCDAVASAATQDPAPDELLVVTDHNALLERRVRDELLDAHPGLRVLPNRRKQGLSGARNTALEEVTSDVVVFLDDDAAADPGWLARLTAPYADDLVLAVGGSASPRWPEGAERPVTLPAAEAAHWGELDWVVGCTYAGQPTTSSPVRNVMGCNMSFRRGVFAAIGGFSEDLGRVGRVPLGCEETELCIRATAANPGTRIMFQPDARVSHHVSPDRLTWSYLLRRCYAEGLSKAAVARMVGQQQALVTERSYATRVLPAGVLRELVRAVRRRQPEAAASAVAVVAALLTTGVGYLRGRAARPELVTGAAPSLSPLGAGADRAQ